MQATSTTDYDDRTNLPRMAWNKALVGAYIRHRLETELAAKDRSAAELAREIGILPQTLSQLTLGQRGVGMETLDKIATHYGVSHDELVRDAAKWSKANPDKVPAATTTVDRRDRYANRAVAVEFARRSGVDPKAIEIVQSVSLKAATDPSPREWLAFMESEAMRLKGGLPPGVPLSAEQVASTEPNLPWAGKKGKR